MPDCFVQQLKANPDDGGNLTKASLRVALQMLARYELCMRPDAKEIQEDYPDQFNEYSTSEVSKCRRIGLKVEYQTDWTVDRLLARSRPLAPLCVSMLHMGPRSAPYGPGYWMILTGRGRAGRASFNVPCGAFDLLNGGLYYPVNIWGDNIDSETLAARFCAHGPNSGHVITIS